MVFICELFRAHGIHNVCLTESGLEQDPMIYTEKRMERLEYHLTHLTAYPSDLFAELRNKEAASKAT